MLLRFLSTVTIALVAFAAGVFVAPHLPRADAEASPIVAQAIDLAALKAGDLPAPSRPGAPRSKLFVDAESMTLGVYLGHTARHYHANANEFQYVVQGTGSEWFGNKRIALHPGMLLVIPKGMPHGGLSDGVKILGMKTPPQATDDNHRIK